MFLLDWSYCDTSALPLSRPGRRLKINLSWALFWVLWKCSITVGLHQQNALLCQLLCQWWLTPSLALRNPAVPPASLCCDLGAPPFREDVRRHRTSYLSLQPCYLPHNSESANQSHRTANSPSPLRSKQLACLSQLWGFPGDVRHKNGLKGHTSPTGVLQAHFSLFEKDGEQLPSGGFLWVELPLPKNDLHQFSNVLLS